MNSTVRRGCAGIVLSGAIVAITGAQALAHAGAGQHETPPGAAAPHAAKVATSPGGAVQIGTAVAYTRDADGTIHRVR